MDSVFTIKSDKTKRTFSFVVQNEKYKDTFDP